MKYYCIFMIGVITGVMALGIPEAQQTECIKWQLEYEHDPLNGDHYIDEIMPNQFK